MPEQRRRVLLKAAATSVASLLAAGCISTNTGQSSKNQTDETQTSSTKTTAPTTQLDSEDYGPWSVTVDNNLDGKSTVTVRILTSNGDLHKKEKVTVAGGGGTSALTVTESGTYTLEASASFDSGTMVFKACKLNSEAIVQLYTDEDEQHLEVSQRHTDPGAGITVNDPYTCNCHGAVG